MGNYFFQFMIICGSGPGLEIFLVNLLNPKLKPQDGFGEFDNFFLASESAGNHQNTPSDLPAIVLNDIL